MRDALGPTVYAALSQIAHDNGCVLMPIENVLLIGPEEWVDQVAADAWGSVDDKNRNRNDANRTDTIQLNWEALTTPKEAIEQVIGEAANLPHDLWPAVKLSAIRRPLAELLIRSQFREPVKPVVKQYEHRYIDTGGVLTLEQVRQNDRHTKLRRSKNAMVVTATPAAHRLLLKNWLMGNSPKHSNEEATFSLKTKVKAGAIITQLAKTAGWVCQIDEPAMEACQTTSGGPRQRTRRYSNSLSWCASKQGCRFALMGMWFEYLQIPKIVSSRSKRLGWFF